MDPYAGTSVSDLIPMSDNGQMQQSLPSYTPSAPPVAVLVPFPQQPAPIYDFQDELVQACAPTHRGATGLDHIDFTITEPANYHSNNIIVSDHAPYIPPAGLPPAPQQMQMDTIGKQHHGHKHTHKRRYQNDGLDDFWCWYCYCYSNNLGTANDYNACQSCCGMMCDCLCQSFCRIPHAAAQIFGLDCLPCRLLGELRSCVCMTANNHCVDFQECVSPCGPCRLAIDLLQSICGGVGRLCSCCHFDCDRSTCYDPITSCLNCSCFKAAGEAAKHCLASDLCCPCRAVSEAGSSVFDWASRSVQGIDCNGACGFVQHLFSGLSNLMGNICSSVSSCISENACGQAIGNVCECMGGALDACLKGCDCNCCDL
eukprot:GILK01013809.1.p1 GENE.GILK01013809.1~~GILK01013809.1.p1  ORF type:complete len:370 (-),score=7.27 GILK01013809.1:179-1288(-)